jgi:3-dehydroquinate synthase
VRWANVKVPAPIPSSLAGPELSARYSYESAGLLDTPTLIALIRDFRPTGVMHLAAALRDQPADELFATNVQGTRSLLEAVAAASEHGGFAPPLVVLASSGSVYGAREPSELPLREEDTCLPGDDYAISKKASEDVARVKSKLHSIPLVCARIFNVVGPGQDERHFCGWLASQLAASAEDLRPPVIEVGPLETTRDFVDVRDVAAALIVLFKQGTPGQTYNVASGVETPVKSVYDQLVELAGLKGSIAIKRRPGRGTEIPRVVADINRLQSHGFRGDYTVGASLGDLLEYYREDVSLSASLRNGTGQTQHIKTVTGHVGSPGQSRCHSGRRTLPVTVERTCHYEVHLESGLLKTLPAYLSDRWPGTRMALVTDDLVDALYGKRFLDSLLSTGLPTESVVLKEGECSKSPESVLQIIEALHSQSFDRRALVVNLGGGLVTDVGGFAAAIYMRGVRYINVPTTLVAQHDAAIGGKVAVNVPWAKNFVGAFHHPQSVFCDPSLLSTLNSRQLSSGVAESIKIAVICDPGLFELLEKEVDAIRYARDPSVLGEVVYRSARSKIDLVSRDPYEADLRRELNFGHTIGHPIETALGYRGILHGEAVAFGMAVCTAIAEEQGICEPDSADRILALLAAYDLPPHVPYESLTPALEHLSALRLVRGHALNLVLPERVGSVRVVPEVDDRQIMASAELVSRSLASGSLSSHQELRLA